jgi:hypothetical protein
MSSYILNVTLTHIRPKIWRQLRVPGDLTLAGLHEALQIAFGWENSHLHEFEVGKKRYGMPDPDDDREIDDEADVTVAQALPHKSSTMQYVYDLGDYWIHTVAVERIEDAPAPRGPRPLGARGPTAPLACLAGKRACPPEDCGGPSGYADFLEAIHTPDHPQHTGLLEWVGGAFDPEALSLREINDELSSLGE